MVSTPILLIFLALISHPFALGQSTYYVSQTTQSSFRDGSTSNPFSSITEAIEQLGSNTVELFLLGTGASLSSLVQIPPNSNYHIKPDPSFSGAYFPLTLDQGASIVVGEASLTFEKIEFIETDLLRDPSNPTITMATGSIVTLKKTMLRDLKYPDSLYQFIFSGEDTSGAQLSIVDAQFLDLENLYIALSSTKLDVDGTTFSGLSQTTTCLFFIIFNVDPGSEITFTNIFVEKSYFAFADGTSGLLDIIYSSVDVTFKNFMLRDNTLASDAPFMILNFASDATTLPLVNVQNGTVHNCYENVNPGIDETQKKKGLFLDISGADLNLADVYFKNIHTTYGGSISVNSPQSTANIRSIIIESCSSANFYFTDLDAVNLRDFLVKNYAYNTTDFVNHLFSLGRIKDLKIMNFLGENVSGPLVEAAHFLNISVSNCAINNAKASQDVPAGSQKIFRFYQRQEYMPSKWLDLVDKSYVTVDSFSLNGYTEVNGIDSTKHANDTFVLDFSVQYAKYIYPLRTNLHKSQRVYVTNSRIYNSEMGAIFIGYATSVEVQNSIFDADPTIPSSEIARHRIFQVCASELVIKDCKFLNHQNAEPISVFQTSMKSDFPAISQINVIVENMVAMNIKSFPMEEIDESISYRSIFIITSFSPAKISINSSTFKDNILMKGVIEKDSAPKIDVDITNSRFENNHALQSGTIIWAQSIWEFESQVNLYSNIFVNNTCQKSGGLFYLAYTKHNINLVNNIYMQNSANNSGGVGYLSRSQLTFSEKNGVYVGNSARNLGGTWYFDINREEDKSPLVIFTQTSFESSSSMNHGGAFYIQRGDIQVQNCSFKGITAVDLGGVFYLTNSASLKLQQISSTGSTSSQGAFLYAEALFGDTVFINQSQIINVPSRESDTSLIFVNLGAVVISDSTFKNISTSLFQSIGGSLSLATTSISQIYCRNQVSFCVFQGKNSDFSAKDTQISDVISPKNLISVENPTRSVTIDNIKMSNVQKPEGYNQTELFALVLKRADLKIQNSSFTQLAFSSIRAERSKVNIAGTVFSNAVSQRMLQQPAAASTTNKLSFMTLDSCNVSVTDTSFLVNSPTPTLNGGAIQLTGQTGNVEISRTTFQGNTGLNGGAISLEGLAGAISIKDSELKANQASDKGGAIFLNNQGNIGSLNISQTKFENNQANLGGAAYVSNLPTTVDSSVFSSNKAMGGGAISYLMSNNQKLSLIKSTFSQNTGQIGAALMALGSSTFDNQGTTFLDNKADAGGDIISIPKKLGLRVYDVSEAFLFLEDVPMDYIITHYQTKLIYDAQNSSLQDPLILKSGRTPNYLFEFVLLDELNKPYSRVQRLNLGINQLPINKSSSSKILTTIIGKMTYNFTDYTGFVFNSFSVRGPLETKLSITIEATVQDSIFKQIYNLSPLTLPITIGPCTVGEIYDSQLSVCNPCLRNSMSYEDPFVAQTCQLCPRGAACLGGNVIYPQQNYWRIHESSANFVKCFNQLSCLGGLNDEGRNISLTGFCRPGYEGVGCGVCELGYVIAGSNRECLSCAKDTLSHVKFVVSFLVQIVLTILTIRRSSRIRSHISSVELDIEERKFNNLKATLTKVLIDFIQVVNMIMEINLNWPSPVEGLLDVSGQPTPSMKDVFSLDCIIGQIRGTNDHIFIVKLLILAIQPFVFIGCGILAWVIIFMVKKSKIRGSSDFGDKIILTSVIIMYILQPEGLRMTFSFFECHNYGPLDDRRYFLEADTSIECWKSEHITWLLSLGIPSLLIWFVIPAILLIGLVKRKKLAKSEEFRNRYNFMFEKYNPNTSYWDVVIISRKLLLIIVVVFVTYPYLQAYLGFGILVLAYLMQRKFAPYSDSQINMLERISIYLSAGLLYSGVFFVRTNFQDRAIPLLFVLDIIGGAVFFGYCVYVVLRLVRMKLSLVQKKLDGIIDTDSFKLQCIRRIYKKIKLALGAPLDDQIKQTPDQDQEMKSITNYEALKQTEIPVGVQKEENVNQETANNPSSKTRTKTESSNKIEDHNKEDIKKNNDIEKVSQASQRDEDEKSKINLQVNQKEEVIGLSSLNIKIPNEEDGFIINFYSPNSERS